MGVKEGGRSSKVLLCVCPPNFGTQKGVQVKRIKMKHKTHRQMPVAAQAYIINYRCTPDPESCWACSPFLTMVSEATDSLLKNVLVFETDNLHVYEFLW